MENVQGDKLRGMRAVISERMHASLQSTAQLTFHCRVDASALQEQRERLRQDGNKVSYEDLIVKAVSDTLSDYPAFNALFRGDRVEVSEHHNICVAVSLPDGLMAPAIADVQTKSIEDIAAARRDLVVRARKGALKPAEMTSGTFTVSNLGLRRVEYFTPILNAPQVALLGIGQLQRLAVVMEDDSIQPRPMIGLSLTADHRWLDGDPCGQFLSSLCERLEQGIDDHR